jgi:hypothetical protein
MRARIFAIFLAISLLLFARPVSTLAQEPLPPRPDNAGASLPPRPEPEPARQAGDRSSHSGDYASLGGHITLVAGAVQAGAWAGVQWQDGASGWHDVGGWQGRPSRTRGQDWWVDARDFGTGPFRWLVYQDASKSVIVAESEPFNLPSGPDEVVVVSADSVAPESRTEAPVETDIPPADRQPSLSLSVAPAAVEPGQVVTLTWKSVFENTTPEIQPGVTVRHSLPKGLVYVSGRSMRGNVSIETGNEVVAHVGDVTPGERIEILIETRLFGDGAPGTIYEVQATAGTTGESVVTLARAGVVVGGSAIMPETGGLLESPATPAVVLAMIGLGLALYLHRRRSSLQRGAVQAVEIVDVDEGC